MVSKTLERSKNISAVISLLLDAFTILSISLITAIFVECLHVHMLSMERDCSVYALLAVKAPIIRMVYSSNTLEKSDYNRQLNLCMIP